MDGVWLVHYQFDDQVVDIRRLRYPPCRLRYLRVRVFPDRSHADDHPEFSSLTVFHTVQEPGEYVTREAQFGPREAVRAAGGPGSAWIIDLGGRQVPCEKLSIDVADAEFVRPFVVEMLDGEGPRQIVANGELRRQATDPRKPLVVSLRREVMAHRLRLVVTDHSNPPLAVEAVKYTAAARQVVFAAAKGLVEPLRLYTGNPKACAAALRLRRHAARRSGAAARENHPGSPYGESHFRAGAEALDGGAGRGWSTWSLAAPA